MKSQNYRTARGGGVVSNGISRRAVLSSALAAAVLGGGCAMSKTRLNIETPLRLSSTSPTSKARARTTVELIFPTAGSATTPTWEVHHPAGRVLLPSSLGLRLLDGQILGAGAQVLGYRRQHVQDEWTPIFGEHGKRSELCEELSVELLDPTLGIRFDIVVRTYDGGVALRYLLRHSSTSSVSFAGEATHFKFPAEAKIYSSRDEGEYQVSSPAAMQPEAWPALSKDVDRGPLADVPLTVVLANGLCALITESDRRHYPRLMLRSAVADASSLVTHTMQYPGRADGFYVAGDADEEASFSLTSGDKTPWRVIMVGSSPLALIEHSGLVTALATPSVLTDTAWIKPGRAMRIMTRTTDAGLACIDFAARHQLEYVMYDAHWYGDGKDESDATIPIPEIDIHKVIDYGKARGVGLFVYVDREPVKRQLDTLLDTYQRWGIAGIKFGFILEGRQQDSDFLFELINKCAQRRLLVNLHDNLRPAGWERTLPNYLTLEGVRGNEQFPTARHNVTLPFTRGIAGPMDYTICYAQARNRTTNAHQLAMAVVFYSPYTMYYWYDSPDKYASGEWPELSWFDECPTSWDETRALAGEIGEYIVIARRKGQRWFLGAMTNEAMRTVPVSLNFLGKGDWIAHRYADGPVATVANQTTVVINRQTISAAYTLHLSLAPSGGQAIRFEAV